MLLADRLRTTGPGVWSAVSMAEIRLPTEMTGAFKRWLGRQKGQVYGDRRRHRGRCDAHRFGMTQRVGGSYTSRPPMCPGRIFRPRAAAAPNPRMQLSGADSSGLCLLQTAGGGQRTVEFEAAGLPPAADAQGR